MDYEQKYRKLVDAIKEMRDVNPSDEGLQNWISDNVPELAESEDERIRKHLISLVKNWDKDGIFSKYTSNPEEIKQILAWLEKQGEPVDKGEISDGFHTFNELYYYRLLYNAAFFNMLPKEWVHKSKKHNDGEECFGGGWFIVMANLPTGQISNHYELKDWDLFQIPEKERADKWDGHTPQEAAERLHNFLLEKQGEQKPTDKVKPRFNVGEWIVWQDKCYKVNYNGCGYELVDQNGLSTSLEYETIDENAHLWTINDAREGDVLVSEVCDTIILFRGIKDNNIDFYCDYDFSEIDSVVNVTKDRFAVHSGDEHYGSVEDAEDIHPATKEQRDTLMQAMTNAGWQFDFEKKELKKNNQNSAWSEEDEDAIGMAIIALEDMYDEDAPNTTYGGYNLPFNKAAERLKLLKDRVIPQSKQEWSEEDELNLKGIIAEIEANKNSAPSYDLPTYDKFLNWLESLKNKIINE